MTTLPPTIALPQLIDDPSALAGLAWEPFRPGIEAAWIYRSEDGGPAAAFLRYQPGARAPRHRHAGWEVIVVIEGSQTDPRDTYGAGSVVFNPPDSEHDVVSHNGCTALLVWERTPVFVEAE